MNGRTDPDLKKEIVQRLLNADDDLKIVVCTAVLSMGIDMAGNLLWQVIKIKKSFTFR